MNTTSCSMAAALVSAFLLAGRLSADDVPPDKRSAEKSTATEGAQLFEQTILPALKENCFACHSQEAETTEGGLELDSPAGLRRGGDTGPMLKAHSANESHLLKMLRHEDGVSAMPPEQKLSDKTIAAFEQWIRLGAPDTREDTGPTAKEQRMAEAKQHWSLQPPQITAPPEVNDATWPRDLIIDRFVLAAMEAEGLKPVNDANRRTLIRRLYFDLIGLPPSPDDVDTFLADESKNAVAGLVDRLLASPQFGERWGRHWLDVVRYAESSGMEFNFTYPHAWPYRDYVIDSFNSDKRFDDFLREQIAGDLLPTDGVSAADVESRRIAPSVLAFGPKRHNSSGTDFRINIADDQIDVVFKSTMGLTVSCARCHDHKFDPIPTKDYYALAGIFLSTEPMYGTIKQKYSNTPTDLLPIGENAVARHEAAEAHDKQLDEANKTLTAKKDELKKATAALAVAAKEKTAAEELLAAISARQNATQADSADSAVSDTSEQDGAKSSADEAVTKHAAAAAAETSLQAEVANLEAQIAELKKGAPRRPNYAMTVRDRAKPADTKVAVRGDYKTLGDVAPRGFLSAVNVPGAAAVNPKASGRQELAEWIASPDNPLTARVMVNRIWHHLFGRGIVSTVDNFGVIGKPPTHPELLDMLTLRFTEDGWSVKRMVRAVVLSRAYQLSSHVDEHNRKVDPDNRLFWRAAPRRLEAEAIRDAILTVSGQLDLTRPEGSTVTGLGDTLVRGLKYEKIQPPSNHRSVYLPVVRDYVPELFDLFDFPSPSLVSGQRAITNVPSQALYLRNSSFVAEQSKLAADRLLAVKDVNDIQRVELATRWALGRNLTDTEQAAALQLVEQTRTTITNEDKKINDTTTIERDAWSAWFLTLFTTAEFRYLVDVE
ncbi:MAG: PSD1 domain-containing protein [Planctomycetaceae bacterium]|nr:PSD1 domain-containing protein [Planctomycetaceae bacterium]